MRKIHALILLAALLAALAGNASALEVPGGSVLCFTPGDFGDESLVGICLTMVPREKGTIQLDSRVLRPGDVLTAQQVSQMTFSPLPTVTDQQVEVGYLAIYEDRVTEPQTMTVSILGRQNQPPVAEDSALETYRNLPNTGHLKAQDPEGEALTVTVVRQPRRGTVEIGADGSFTYTPKKNKVGVDSFTYTASDPAGNVSREATVTITILKPTQPAQYTDTQGRSCAFEAEWMRHTGIFAGETVGKVNCFMPDRTVTRGEFVTMLVKTLDIPTDEAFDYTPYDDQVPDWLKPYVAAAVRAGLTTGLEDPEIFDANRIITESEAQQMLPAAIPTWSPQEATPLTRETAAIILYQYASMNS